ncbi:unnamed protein product, partial [Ceratitis capitata]
SYPQPLLGKPSRSHLEATLVIVAITEKLFTSFYLSLRSIYEKYDYLAVTVGLSYRPYFPLLSK